MRFATVTRSRLAALVLVAAAMVPAVGASTVPAGAITILKPVTRLWGEDRIATAIAVSKQSYPTAGSASAVVLAQGYSGFADALAGTPLAVAKNAPLLMNPVGGLDDRVKAEIQRLLIPGQTVYVLGGAAAVDAGVDATLHSLGYAVVRYAGADRYETATIIADKGLGNPPTVFEATAWDFPDALAAGAAATKAGAAILLTAGPTQPQATAAYLTAHPSVTRFTIGGPATKADPMATAVVGVDRFDTAAKVASRFFSNPTVVAVSDGLAFADALSGGAHIGRLNGPLLLVRPTVPLPEATDTYLTTNKTFVTEAFAYGGPAAIGDGVLAAVQNAIS